nr:hypothetical protein [Tanacetum cinerariifolium]
GELEQIMENLIQDNKHLEERLDSHGSRLYTLENLNIPQQVSKAVDEIVTDAVDWAIQALLWNRFKDLLEENMKEILLEKHAKYLMLLMKNLVLPSNVNADENLKLTVKEQLILKKLASSTGTLSSLQHLAKDISFGDLFFDDKPSEAENQKTIAETEAESMVSVTIQQDTSAIPPMTTHAK